ncbi:Bug family tripartite tricarboxylate transporter substrate binding protein [Pararoseomonas indoligenes]|uniref:Tripartite tricarboxylate transporter substrate binding protein n=1 Tax=Roseomonas indoligenes TaxID=2820811 RepID=A0A940N1G7_9PROT|nr:tripartite tricarboxylate transporter substrate binding protein [Pararoseomonas indoligenes]MBP0495518.1 tripartite tricarboxylate transporter substrate binding protein [Pararoseomonas indoligenes]
MACIEKRKLGQAALALAFGGLAGRPARAQGGWPSRSVTMIVPWAPGGSNDVVARLLSPGLQKAFGKSFVVENRAGGGGAVGMGMAARARPDGHTLLISSASNHVFNHFVVPDQGYDPREALSAICMMVDVPNALAVHPSLGVSDVQGLLAKIRATPGGLSYASTGVGSSNHLAGELLRLRAGVELNHVPYRGGGPALADLISGTIPVAFLNLPTVLPAVEAGQVRLLGIGGKSRIPSRPDIPTIGEQGVEGYEIQSWTGLFTPRGTPRPVIERVAAEVKGLLGDPTTRERLVESGSENIWAGPDETDAFVRAEFDRWGPIVKQAGVTNG